VNNQALQNTALAGLALTGVLLIACGGAGTTAPFTSTANIVLIYAGDYTGDKNPITGGTTTVTTSGGKTVLTLTTTNGRKLTTKLPTTRLTENQTFPVATNGAEIEYEEGVTRSHGGPHWSGIGGSITVKSKGSLATLTFNNGTSIGVGTITGFTQTTTTTGDGGTYNVTPVGPNNIHFFNPDSSNASLSNTNSGQTIFTGGGTSEYVATFYVGTQAVHTRKFIVNFGPSSTSFTPNSASIPLQAIRYEQQVGLSTLVWEGTAGQILVTFATPNTLSLNNVVMSPVSGGATGTFTVSGVMQY
jgi:hypothetical protein